MCRMKCEFCNPETSPRKVRKRHRFSANLHVVENVDAEVCDECGERYYPATTLDAIDKRIEGNHTVQEVLSVEGLSADEG
jgi:YgiT-type zinc finger domain-containing protein